MPRRKPVKYVDLPRDPGDIALVCVNPICRGYGLRYSACRGDYFMAKPETIATCGDCEEPMILAREQRRLVAV
jgi:hypothetical protein